MPHRKANRENRKLRFLKAFARIGTISGAAKASRNSRDAVYDWMRVDDTFVRMFAHAKRRHDRGTFDELDASLTFFTNVTRPVIPAEAWPRVASALAIAVANLKNDLKGGRRLAAPGEVAEFSLPHNGFVEVAIPNRGRDDSADDL